MARDKKRSAEQPGEVLGIGHITPSTVNDESRVRPPSSADEARRQRRMNEGADELVPGTQSTPAQHGGGAAGVDMGAGGEGTDIE
ncbi:MAG TPA: hypothetical protein VH138_05025 [Vicinamibacterales bacterium]|nr:hypothetical protein [Vicinamibacterales bacterium]